MDLGSISIMPHHYYIQIFWAPFSHPQYPKKDLIISY